MTNQITNFFFQESDDTKHEIRVITRDGDYWFVAADVCAALGLTNPTVAVSNLDDDEKQISSDTKLNLGSAGHGAQSLTLISESGLFTLILRCRDAVKQGTVAHRFRKWVTAEVLPTIRKTGSYIKLPVAANLPGQYRDALDIAGKAIEVALLFGLTENQAKFGANNLIKKATGVNLLGDMDATSFIAPPDDQQQLLTVSDIAQRLSIGKREVNPLLIKAGLQVAYRDTKNKLCYELTSLGQAYGIYLDTAKTHTDGTPVRQIKWRSSVVDYLNESRMIH